MHGCHHGGDADGAVGPPPEEASSGTPFPKHYILKAGAVNDAAGFQLIHDVSKDTLVKAYVFDETCRKQPYGAWGTLYIMDRPTKNWTDKITNPYGAGVLYQTGLNARILPDGTLDVLERCGRTVMTENLTGREYLDLGRLEETIMSYGGIDHAEAYTCWGPEHRLILCADIVGSEEPDLEKLKAYIAKKWNHVLCRSRSALRRSRMGNVIEITDFNAAELDVYARLTEAQLLNKDRPEDGIFIAESPKVIGRALDAGYEPVSFLAEKQHIDEGETGKILSCCGDIPVYIAEFDVLTQLTGYKLTRGMLCAMRRRALPSVREICRNAERIAILENVMNPTNVGAAIRSAAALNMDAVLLTPGCSNPLYRRAIRVSMGTVFQIPWTILREEEAGKWPEEGMAFLGRLGYRTAAMALRSESADIDDERLRREKKLAVILGTEGDGLMDGTIERCDYTIKIPMAHGVDSLNVAAASAVAFWELGRRRAEPQK